MNEPKTMKAAAPKADEAYITLSSELRFEPNHDGSMSVYIPDATLIPLRSVTVTNSWVEEAVGAGVTDEDIELAAEAFNRVIRKRRLAALLSEYVL